ncbi:MAG: DUF3365 domain-containing protein [Anaeromyxobacter sp.]|nr:DUF3365 domain-containing protein [Anaeromyxobacter sp.]MBL0277086.1 DUF3365 domain-containing protein [Anaeromyxobacter sp.]
MLRKLGQQEPQSWGLLVHRLAAYTALVALAWTAVMGASLSWALREEDREAETRSLTLAETLADERLLTLRWAASQRAIYLADDGAAPIDGSAASGPAGMVLGPGGVRLALVSAQTLTARIFRLEDQSFGVTGRAVSLRPLGAAGAPEAWEAEALRRFERGERQVHELAGQGQARRLRFARALQVEAPCLRCHGPQGQALGDLRGAVTLEVPLERVGGQSAAHGRDLAAWHALLWLAGLGAIALGSARLRARLRQLEAAANALRESQARLARILEATSDGYYEVELPTGALFLSPGWARRFGEGGGALADLVRTVHPDDRPRFQEALDRCLDGSALALECEHRVQGPDGATHWRLTRGKVVQRDAGGAPLLLAGVVADVDAHKRLEDQLDRVDRLAALGTLAAGVAHELNGPLACAGSNLGHATWLLGATPLAATPAGAEALAALADAGEGVRRAALIVRDLRTFSRPDERLGPVSVRAAVEAALSLARPMLAQRAELRIELQDVPLVVASHDRLVQVFLNLLVNAAQALPAERERRDQIRVATLSDHLGGVAVEVSDTGVGIAPHDLARLFDPFFTTKPPGQGTGLGLSVSHGIVTRLGGRIEVDSAVGRGTTFRVVLPRDPPARA